MTIALNYSDAYDGGATYTGITVADGDLMVVTILSDSGLVGESLAGWTSLPEHEHTIAALGYQTLYRVADSESGSVDFGTIATPLSILQVFRDSVGGGSWSIEDYSTAEADSTTSTTAAVAVSTGDCLYAAFLNDGGKTISTAPATMTEIERILQAARSIVSYYEVVSSPDATATRTLEWNETEQTIAGAVVLRYTVAGGGATGTIAETLEDAASAASGIVTNVGSIATTLAATTMVATGSAVTPPTGTINEVLDDTTINSVGILTIYGSGSSTLAPTTSSISATITINGALAETIDDITQAADGIHGDVVVGSIAQTIDDIIVVGSGVVPYVGVIGSVLNDVVMSASGTAVLNISGTLSELLADVGGSASGSVTVQPTGTINSQLDNTVAAASGVVLLNVTGSLSELLEATTGTASGTVNVPTILTAQDIINIVDAIFSRVVEGSETFQEQLRLIRAEAAGKLTVTGSTVYIRDADDTLNRIVAVVDSSGQRTSVTTDVS